MVNREVPTDCAVAADARIGSDSEFGPYCVIGLDGPLNADPLWIGVNATLRSHTVMYRGVRTGNGFQTGHGALVREHTVIGDDVSIGSHSVVEHHVVIGHRVRLHSGCFVPEYSVLEDDAWLGPGVILTNSRYPNQPDSKAHLEGVVIREGATIGAGAVLLPGIEVGERALVGAGAVVAKDVPPDTTVLGNPARITR